VGLDEEGGFDGLRVVAADDSGGEIEDATDGAEESGSDG
jgi:hypothetical protein